MEPLRRQLWVGALLVAVGVPVELLLAGHVEPGAQLLPFAASLALAGAVLIGWRSPDRVRWVRGVAVAVIAVAAFGAWEHFESNDAFVVELNPDASGVERLVGGLTGAGPVLAPGMLVLGAFLAWSATLAGPRPR